MVRLKDDLTLDASLLHGINGASLPNEAKYGHRNTPTRRPPICPYVSSTFVDLEEEFKYLHTSVFPQLNDLCHERGSYFSPFDFRRTAIDNRSSADLILKHSLDNVKYSMPFFICIIGSQYGPHRSPTSPSLFSSSSSSFSGSSTLPNLTMVDQNLLMACHDYPWIVDKDFHTCSMMELEVTLACFRPEMHFPKHCFFYIQECFQTVQSNAETLLESESEYAQGRLHDLKTKIISKGFPVKFFTTKEELAQGICKDWTNVIMNLLPPLPSYHIPDDELFLQTQHQERLIHSFHGRYYKYQGLGELEEELFYHALPIASYTSNISTSDPEILYEDELFSKDEVSLSGYKVGDGIFSTAALFLETLKFNSSPDVPSDGEKSILALIGGAGSGKTSFLTNWLQGFRKQHPDVLILSEFVGVSHGSRDVALFLRRCIRRLREKYFNVKSTSKELVSDVGSYKVLVDNFASSLQLLPCLIVVDSINDFEATMNQDIGLIKSLTWLPKAIPSTCKIIFTTRQSDLSYKVLRARNDVMMTWMPHIDLSVRKAMFELHLGANASQLLDYEDHEKIWNNKLSEQPLFLAVLSSLLLPCRSTRERHQVLEKCTSLRNFRDFWKAVFVIWSRRYGWSKKSPGQPGSIRGRSAIGWVVDALKLIVSSRCGLSRCELIHLLSLSGYRGRSTVTLNDWEMFRAATTDVLATGSDGLIRIGHEDAFLVIRNVLFVSDRASARASGSYIEAKQQRFHLLLSSYFLKFGSMQRKLTELPWQLRKSNDWLTLCQVLTKPRFFLAMCEASQWHPSLYMDHVTYWKELNERDFDVSHCLQTMLDGSSTEVVDAAAIDDQQVVGRPGQSAAGDGGLKLRQPPLRGPAIIVVTQHDDASIHKSTEDSMTETEDKDYYSETESTSFFITETDVDHHLLVAGWHPSEGDPECAIDDAVLDEDESAMMQQKVAWFLYQLEKEFRAKADQVTESAIFALDSARPLSSSRLLSLFEAVLIGCQKRFSDNIELMQRALEIFDHLSLQSMDLSHMKKRELAVSAADLRLQLADALISEDRLEESRALILQVFEGNKKWKSVYCKAQATRMFGKLLMSSELIPQSEQMLINAFAIFSKWSGKKHVNIASTLEDLGRLYSNHFVSDKTNQRKAMLAYKQALEIYQFRSMPMKVARTYNKIGKLLLDEGSLRSKKEAYTCFEQSLNVLVTNEPLQKDKISHVSSRFKKVLSDLTSGRFIYGTAKPRDERTPVRPHSSLTFRSDELNKISDDTATIITEEIRNPRSLMRTPPVQRPYTAYSATSLGCRMLVTPRNLYNERQTSSAPVSRMSSRRWSSRSDRRANEPDRKDEQSAGDPTASVPHAALNAIHPVRQRPATNEGMEHPVIIVQGQASRGLSSREETYRTYESNLSHAYISTGTTEARSEISTPKRSVRLHAEPQVFMTTRPSPPKHRCDYVSGPEHLSLNVHGPYSGVKDVLRTPPSSRRSARSVDVYHRSAWFHVPGRYTKPGEVLPSKRNQKRTTSAAAGSTFANRSYPGSRSVSRQGFDKSRDELLTRRSSASHAEGSAKFRSEAAASTPSKEVIFLDK